MKTFLDFIEKKNIRKSLNESFAEKDMEKVTQLIANVIKKHTSTSIVPLVGWFDTNVGGEECKTKYYLVIGKTPEATSMFGINWQKGGESNQAYSIDFFNSYDALFSGDAKTALSIYTLGSSIVYFLPVIWTLVNRGNYEISETEAIKAGRKAFDEPASTEEVKKQNESFKYYVGAQCYNVYENLSQQVINDTFKLVTEEANDEVKYFKKQKRAQANAAQKHASEGPRQKMEASQLWAEVREIEAAIKGGATTLDDLKLSIKKNVRVIQEIDELTKKHEEELQEEREDPEVTFKKMEFYIKMVIKGVTPSVILCGGPGVGKTFRVKRALRAAGYTEGDNMYTIKGKCSERVLYLRLYEFRNKKDIVVIDDADGLVGPKAPETVINILKAALDSTDDDEGRLVSYGVSGRLMDDDGNPIPKRMHYRGGVIVITNWNAGSLDTALRGRSYIQDINFTTEDVLKIIKRIMPDIKKDILSPQSKIMAYDYLEELANSGADMEISFRTFGICANLFETAKGDPDFDPDFVQSMIKDQMKMQAVRGGSKH